MRKARILGTLGFLAIFLGAGSFLLTYEPVVSQLKASFASVNAASDFAPVELGDPYVNFELEAYDSIKSNFWKKMTDEELAMLFKLSIEKVMSTTTVLATSDKQGVKAMLESAFASLGSDEQKKQVAQDTLIVALFNLPPAGRNQLLTTQQEKTLREGVSNIHPEKDLYADAGAAQGASAEEVKAAFEEKKAELEKEGTPEAKEKLAAAEYAADVLTKEETKARYDVAKVEPTAFGHRFGDTLYVNLSQMSPTTYDEFVSAVNDVKNAKQTSLIIDLRSNVGGALDISPALVGIFQGLNQYVFDIFRQDEYEPIRSPVAKLDSLSRFKEVAILTDGLTQSTAEVITAALKRLRIAKVVGTTSRGWGTIENTFPLQNTIDPSVKYTMLLVHSLTLGDDNQPIESRGIVPDVDISDPKWKSKLSTEFRSQSLVSAIQKVIPQPPLKN